MSTKDVPKSAIEDIGGTVIQAFGYFLLIILFLLLTLAIALAKLGSAFKDEGMDWVGILKKKLLFTMGVAPSVFVVVLCMGYYVIEKDFVQNEADRPKTEKDFRMIVDSKDSAVRVSESELETARNQLEWRAEEPSRIKARIAEAQTVEDESEAKEDYKENAQKLRELKANIASLTTLIEKQRAELESARQDLKAAMNGTYTRRIAIPETPSMSTGKKLTIYGGAIVLGLQYLFLSLLLSYAAPFLWPRNKRFESFADFSLVCWEAVSRVGLVPYNFILYYFDIRPKEKDETPTVMRLGKQPKAYLTNRNLNYHTQVIGGSGAGKTNLLKVMIEDRVRRGHSVLFFDFKADIELMDWMTGLASSAGRRGDLEMISMSDPAMSFAYNPLATGDETELSSQIMNSLNWSETYYRDTAESGLMIILKVMCFIRKMTGRPFHLGHIYFFLTDASYRIDVVAEAARLIYPDMYRADLRRISEELSTNKKDNYQGLVSQLSKVLNSSAGDILSNKCDKEVEFEFRDAIEKGKIAYLFMNSLKLKETASVVGKMMLQDLMKVIGNIYDDRSYIRRPTTLIIDEFASFATPDFGEFIEKARGAGLSVIVAYQSRKSLDHIEENLALKVNENTASKIVFQVQDSEDAEWFCGLVGTKTVEKETHQEEDGILFGGRTGMKSIREVEEFIIHPNVLKRLQTGQALLVCNKVDQHHGVINIKMANHYSEEYKRNIKLKEKLRPRDPAPVTVSGRVRRLPEEIRAEDLV